MAPSIFCFSRIQKFKQITTNKYFDILDTKLFNIKPSYIKNRPIKLFKKISHNS